MSDPRLPAAERAISDRYVTNPAIREAIAASILATFPDPRHGDLVVLRCPDPGEADARFAQSLAENLAQRDVQLVLLADADLNVIPPAEEVWRAAWATQAAGRLTELAAALEEEAGRHRNAYERNAWAGAAEKIHDAVPGLLATVDEERNMPDVTELIAAMREATYFGEAEIASRILGQLIRDRIPAGDDTRDDDPDTTP